MGGGPTATAAAWEQTFFKVSAWTGVTGWDGEGGDMQGDRRFDGADWPRWRRAGGNPGVEHEGRHVKSNSRKGERDSGAGLQP